MQMREITSVFLSPSGQLAVVGICHPRPRTNKRELSLVIVPLCPSGTLKAVSTGKEIYDPNASGAVLSLNTRASPVYERLKVMPH